MNLQRTSQLMASAMEQVVAKNRRFRWRKASSSSSSSLHGNSMNSQPRHFASTTIPKTNHHVKPNKTSVNGNINAIKPFHSFFTQERDAKILFGIVPTLLVVGCWMFDTDYYDFLLSTVYVFPLATILTGFGMLGRENYRLEDNGKAVVTTEDDDDNVVPNRSSSSISSTTESTVDINYTDKAISIEGIEVPVGCDVNGIYLDRHGSGLRCFAFFRGIAVRVYVATFYSPQPFVDGQDVLDSSHEDAPLQMDFTFLRGFTVGQCKLAWEKQLNESVSHRYDGFATDKEEFLAKIATESMKANGTVTVQIQDDRTLIFDQGTYTGEIVGKDFQRAFLSMWFGDKPVTTDLKARLLGEE